MRTFVIYDRKTGEILQTHVQTDDCCTGREMLLQIARPESRDEAVEVLEVDRLTPGAHYRVDLKAKKLALAEKGKGKGAGGASVQPAGGDPGNARTVFVPVEASKNG